MPAAPRNSKPKREAPERARADREPTGAETPPGERSTLEAYFHDSSRPLPSLILLVPLLLFYEYGSVRWLHPEHLEIAAYAMLREVFQALGVVGLHLPSVIVVTLLIIWHMLTGDRWRVRPGLALVMAIEAAVLAVPLLLMAQIVGPHQLAAVGNGDLGAGARATIAIGAGLYEETVFRLIGVTLLHAIAADVLGFKKGPAIIIAVLGSTIAFVLLHEPSAWDARIFYSLAGVYLCAIFALRGFGIVVGAHAIYDLIVLWS